MFRRQEDTIKNDPRYPANLEKLGFFINNADQIRMIGAPEKPFEYHATSIERHNEVRNEALHKCLRKEVFHRLSSLGIDQYYFPGFKPAQPQGPHISILAPAPAVLRSRRRLIVVINDSDQDLGVLSYSRMQREAGVNGGSLVSLATEMVRRNADIDGDDESAIALESQEAQEGQTEVRNEIDLIPGLIVMNTGQLLFSHKKNVAMTNASWRALPRKSISHSAVQISEKENRIEGHRTPAEHVQTVFDSVICNSELVAPDAEIYIIAIGDGLESVLKVLEKDFDRYGTRIAAMGIIQSTVDDSQVSLPTMKALLHQRSRQWKYTDITSDPLQCIELPEGYSTDSFCNDDGKQTFGCLETVHWNERCRPKIALSDVTNTAPKFSLRSIPIKPIPTNTADPWVAWSDPSPVCPTFAGGRSFHVDSVFTNIPVQMAVLSFFEQVAMNPESFYNSDITIYADAILDPHAEEDEVVEVTPEQAEQEALREELEYLREALDACPSDTAKLKEGRVKLETKISMREARIAKLGEEILANGGNKKEEEGKWKPQVEGPKVPFAGAMIDSELIKAAGLG